MNRVATGAGNVDGSSASKPFGLIPDLSSTRFTRSLKNYSPSSVSQAVMTATPSANVPTTSEATPFGNCAARSLF